MLTAPPRRPPPAWPPVSVGTGSIDSMPLNAHVAAPSPKIRPKIICKRFCPRYGMLVGAPEYRYLFAGEYIQMPITTPMIADRVAMPDDQMTTWLHCAP